jgi:sugar lactone lactonase YvrE/predicted Ser/Thr protein kinase
MPPSATDEEILAELLLQWEESGGSEPARQAAERLAAGLPRLAGELERRINLLRQMAWLDDLEPGGGASSLDETVSDVDVLNGRYRLLKPLSRGWFGSLYHATDIELGRDVAIKIPRTRDASSAETLLREARYASRLRHPGIVPVFDAVRDKQAVFLVYEFVRGMNLSQRIAKGPVPWMESLGILRQLVEAISHAHMAGVLHRDINPANILLDSAGKALLADFGSAIAMSQLPFSDSLWAGSVAFTAPEVLLGGEAARETDVYSIGIVFYSMLHGRSPSHEKTGPAIRNAVISPNEWDFSCSRSCPRPVIELCRKMIRKDPSRRLSDPESILKLVAKLSRPFHIPISLIAVMSLLPAAVAGWWWQRPSSPAIPPEVSFEYEHGPSADGTIGGGILKLPVGLAYAPDGTLLVANTAKGQVCRFRWDGGLLQVIGRRGSGLKFLFYPHGIAVAADGTVLVTDHGNHVVHAYGPDGNLMAAVGGYGTSPGRFNEPHGVAVGKDGRVYVGDSGNKRVQVFDTNLKWLESIDLSEVGIGSIVGLLACPDGRLIVADQLGGKIWIVSGDGGVKGALSAGPSFKPLWMAMDSGENIWAGDASKRVVVFGGDMSEKSIGNLESRLSFYPQGMAFSPKGDLAVVNYSLGKVIIVRKAEEFISALH